VVILQHPKPQQLRGMWSSSAAAEQFPRISIAAQKLLAAHVTTATAERNWSAWGRVYDKTRARLSIETAEKLVFVKANMPKEWQE